MKQQKRDLDEYIPELGKVAVRMMAALYSVDELCATMECLACGKEADFETVIPHADSCPVAEFRKLKNRREIRGYFRSPYS